MGRASIPTGLPLDTWATILGIDPWSFNQCRYPGSKNVQCNDVIYQFPWQKDHLSREEIAQAIADAEEMLANELLFWPYPYYKVGEVQLYPRPHQRDLFGAAGTVRGEWKSVLLNWKKVISGGVFNRTYIGLILNAAITPLDEDGDGINETFSATITDPAIGTITDPNELGLYYAPADRHGEDVNETWRLRPLKVTIAGNTATFRGHRTLLLNPEDEFAVDTSPYDYSVPANFISDLECYRAFTDTRSTDAFPYQGVAEWKNIPDCTQDCTYTIKPLCLGWSNNKSGQPMVSFGAMSTWPFWGREPDRVNVNYVSGLPLENGQIPSHWARIITYLSVSLLANEKCGCDRSNRILAFWRQPVLRFQDRNGSGADSYADNDTNLPMTVGGNYAWQRIRRLRDVEVVGL